ncbi:MAG: diguanylate cyclase [Chloroflexi bacterium]|nr:diguanylate cyclase [Chloroflexota bacterium]
MEKTLSVAILCSQAGEVIEILSDESNILGDIKSPVFFQEIVDVGSKEKANNFMRQIHAEKTVFDWEINILVDDNIRLLNFYGICADHEMIIIGIEKKDELKSFSEEFTKINSEQVSVLRRAIKEKVQLDNQIDVQKNEVNELSRLNNELTSLQRELTKKNLELEKLYKQMQEVAVTDRLTKIYNRWGFYELAEKECERAKRYSHPLSIITFDLDYFKKVNDTYGHAIGDLVLEKTVAYCKKELRTSDIFGRMGGEEFAVLMPESDEVSAGLVAERIRQALSEPIVFDENSLTITVSIGVASLSEELFNLEKMLWCADRALYKAKENGRNKVVVGCGDNKKMPPE